MCLLLTFKKGGYSNAIKLTNNGIAQVGGELANPNGTNDIGVRKLTTNLEQTENPA